MSALAIAPVQPDEADVFAASKVLPDVTQYLASHKEHAIRLVAANEPDKPLVVPRGALELLERILAHMAAGHGVSVVPADAELTTQQAADLLNVSRPFLIGLLDSGQIDFRKVGKHRRIKAQSLLSYRAKDDLERRNAADELTRLSQEMGLA